MTRFLRGMTRAVAETLELPGPVLEVGSLQVERSPGDIDLRDMFAGKSYTGLDFRAGPGVDTVGNVEAMPFADASFGTVVGLSVFEHVQRFWKGFDEVERVLASDGVFLVAVPFQFHVHGYPSDYWRFTPEALDFLLERYPVRLIGWHGAERRMSNVWAIAFKDAASAPDEAGMIRLRERMGLYAKEPLGFLRRLRYGAGRLVGGRRPFAPYLDREKWKLEVRRAA